MIEISSSTENKIFDFVGVSYKLIFYLSILFWILIYALNLLPTLFPSYKAKELAIPLFIAPSIILTVAVLIKGIGRIVLFKIEKDRFPDIEKKSLFTTIPMTELLFEYIEKKSFKKLFLIVILWASEIIGIATGATMFCGFLITFKY